MPEPVLHYTLTVAGSTTKVTLTGELALLTANVLDRLLPDIDRPDLHRIELDLSGLGFVDSTGLFAIHPLPPRRPARAASSS